MASRTLRILGPVRYVFADGLGMATYVFTPRPRRRRTAENFRRLYPDISVRQSRKMARKSFRHFMRTSFDFVWTYAIPLSSMHRHFRAYGVDGAIKAVDENGGGVFALAHFGSWDVAASCAIASGLQLSTVMSPLGPALVTRIAAWARRQQDMEVLITGNAARGLVRAVRRGRFACILCDIPEAGATVDVDFLGGQTKFTTGPAWIARHTHVPVFPVECWNYQGMYRLVIHPPITINDSDSDAVIMQRVARVLELTIRRDPTYWYPFINVYTD
jgi:Kdo2-lipid IVA lauroyltransferase/acyltransferase